MGKDVEVRKAVVFIVEGKSDKNALEHIFKAIYKHKSITFNFTRGDISSDEGITREKILDTIYGIVDAYMKERKISKKDVWQIVQIFDTDGTYVTESSIVEGETSNFLYSTTQISCKDTSKIVRRNEWKEEMMEYLLGISDIKGIPYKCYFMSSNLDHSLYNKQNLTDEEKENYSNGFYELFQNNEKLFVDFLESDVVNGCPNSFPASWRYIKQGAHSLERHTNLHIYFHENPYM